MVIMMQEVYIGHHKSTILKTSTMSNSLRTTVPVMVIQHFNVKLGDKLEWVLKTIENGETIAIVKPVKN